MTEQNGLGRSSATDVLRRLLDERGVEWDYGIRGATTTRFNANGVDLTFTPMRGGLVCSTILTPEQAIAATLGPGTCHMVLREDICGHAYQDTYECSVCGEYVVRETYMGESEPPNYCPNCGRRCVG